MCAVPVPYLGPELDYVCASLEWDGPTAASREAFSRCIKSTAHVGGPTQVWDNMGYGDQLTHRACSAVTCPEFAVAQWRAQQKVTLRGASDTTSSSSVFNNGLRTL